MTEQLPIFYKKKVTLSYLLDVRGFSATPHQQTSSWWTAGNYRQAHHTAV
jgi:hypothetical protein